MANVVCDCGSTFPLDKVKGMDKCPVCGKPWGDCEGSGNEEEHPDWITWYYYKDPKYGDYSLWDKLPLKPEELELIKEFKAPSESECGLDEVKRILRTYIPDAFSETKNSENVIRCPRCGGQEYTLLNRGYSIFTGFLKSGNVKRVCNRCKKEF